MTTKSGFLLLLAAFLMGCGSASEPQSKNPMEDLELALSQLDPEERISEVALSEAGPRGGLVPVHWRVSSVSGPREVVIEFGRGYCVNDQPPPEYEGVNIREEGKDVHITAFIKRPPPPEGNVCRGMGSWQLGTVRIGQDLSPKVKLFDALGTPPQQRWPEKEKGGEKP